MKRLRLFAAGMLLAGVPVLAPCALAQLSAATDTLRLSLAAGEQAEAPLALTNEGASAHTLALSPEPAEGAEGEPGEFLYGLSDAVETRLFTMTDDGNIFVVWDNDGGVTEVKELSPELEILRTFEYTGVSSRSGVRGIAWMPPEDTPSHPEGTLWLLTVIDGNFSMPEDGCRRGVIDVTLTETDFNAVPTGRTVAISVRPGDPDIGVGYCTALPFALGYDPERELFFHLERPFSELWATGLGGEVPEGYPVPQTGYDTGERTSAAEGLDAFSGTLDVMVGVPAGNSWDDLYRVVVADHDGTNTGVETPLMHFAPRDPPKYFGVLGALRSRTDPSVIYFSASKGDLGGDEPWHEQWIYAVRAAPLPPRWLRVAPVAPEMLTLAPGETDTATVRLNAVGLEAGTYEGAVAFREDNSGGDVLLRVPVVLTVTPGVDAEDGVEPEEASRLEVYPNPTTGTAEIALVLGEASEVRVVVYDVLGREVAVLQDGFAETGTHRLRLDAAVLPAGLYVIRAEVDGARVLTQRLTVIR